MAKQLVDVSTKEITLDTPWPLMDDMETKMDLIQEKMRLLRERYNRVQAEMTELQGQGLIYAGTTFKAGKYLYLVYPAKDGEPRKRVYIGQEQDKVQEALAGVERGQKYLECEKYLEQLKTSARVASYYIDNIKQAFY